MRTRRSRRRRRKAPRRFLIEQLLAPRIWRRSGGLHLPPGKTRTRTAPMHSPLTRPRCRLGHPVRHHSTRSGSSPSTKPCGSINRNSLSPVRSMSRGIGGVEPPGGEYRCTRCQLEHRPGRRPLALPTPYSLLPSKGLHRIHPRGAACRYVACEQRNDGEQYGDADEGRGRIKFVPGALKRGLGRADKPARHVLKDV